jgi:parallel beta-helix repeat protein
MSNRNLIQGNTIEQAGAGISLNGDSNTIMNNAADGASPPSVPRQSVYGIFAAAGASHNLIDGNAVNGDRADLHDSNGPPCVNRWVRNHFETSSGAVACIH